MKKCKVYFSQLGRSFIPAIAVMSFFALLLSIGAVLKNPFIIESLPFLKNGVIQFIALILNQSGLVVITYMPIVFAISIATGLCENKNQKGIAGFSALIGYLFMIVFSNLMMVQMGLTLPPNVNVGANNLVSISQTLEMRTAMQTMVLGVQTIDFGVIGGIVVGSLAAFCTNNYAKVQLPLAISFYQGKNFPPIATGFMCMIVGLLVPIVWPSIGGMIYIAAESITSFGGAFGSFLFGTIDRLLVPTGLHHIWYSIAHFTPVGGTAEICGEIYTGTKAITTAALGCAEYTESLSHITRLWLGQGASPIKLFGIPGALVGMYLAADNKKRAKAIVISAACASIFAGVTEPFEFMFLFLAPSLFVIHALLSGLSFMILDLVQASFLGGNNIFELIINGVLQGHKSTWIPIVLVGILMFFVYGIIFYFFIKKFNLKTPGRETENADDDETIQNELIASKMLTQNKDKKEVATYILQCIGGKENIKSFGNCITRLRIVIIDSNKVDDKALNSIPDSMGISRPDSNQIQVIFGLKVDEYANAFEEVVEASNV